MKQFLFKSFVSYLLLTLLIYLSPVPYGYANPVLQNLGANGGSNVASGGSATIKSNGTTETITQTTGSAVIDWSSFNIGGKEKTQFVDPNSSSLTVNRVHDMNASQILGTLSSNGNIVLINPNGVFFSKGSVVDVNGIVATTSNVTNANVMAGRKLNFTPGSNPNATVENQGTITAANAGLVGLVAPNVINSGIITAKLGTVHMASGDTFTFDLYGDGLTAFQVSDAVNQQLVKNTGTINAAGGTIKLTAAAGRQIINSLIDVEGELHAPAVAEQGGTIFIYAAGSNAVPGNVAANKRIEQGTSTVLVSGILDASGKNRGQTGGNISILGDDIAIKSGSYLDASGALSGGNIKIGGDFHGQGPTPTASATVVQNNTTINANATDSGNGGNVVVWSDNYTDMVGKIEATGGANSGNGGYVETSGHKLLSLTDANGNTGTVDAGAYKGTAGTWLLDPEDVNISSSADSDVNTETNTPSAGNTTLLPGGNQVTSTITTSDITTALNADNGLGTHTGTNVIITTGGDAQSGPNGGSITVSNAITATGGGTALTTTGSLTLSSYKDIIINAAITLGGGTNLSSQTVTGGALILDADNHSNNAGAINVGAAISTNGGNITMGGQESTPTNIVAGTGYAYGDAASSGIGIYINAAVNAGSGNIVMNGYGGNTNTNQGGSISLGRNYGVDDTGTITTTGGITIYGFGGSNTAVSSDSLQFGQNFGIYQSGNISAGNDGITLNGTGGNTTFSGSPAVAEGSNYGIQLGGGNLQTTGTGAINITATGGTQASAGSFGDNYGLYIFSNISTASGTITLTGTGLGSSGSSGMILEGGKINSGTGTITLNGIDSNGSTSINTGSSSIIGGTLAQNGVQNETGNIIFNTNTISLNSDTVETTNNVTFAPTTASTTIGVNNSSETLNITSTVLGATTAGSLTIGNTADTGAMNVSATTWSNPLTLISGSGPITVAGAQAMGSNNFTMETNHTPTFTSTVTTTGNITIETAGNSLGIGTGGGTVSLNDAALGQLTYGSLTLGDTVNTGNEDFNDSGRTFTKTLSILSSGNVTLDSQLNSSAAGGSGPVVVLAATGNLVNNSGDGTSTIHLTGGSSPAWAVYSTAAADDTNGESSMASSDTDTYSKTYASAPPSGLGAGNNWIYSTASSGGGGGGGNNSSGGGGGGIMLPPTPHTTPPTPAPIVETSTPSPAAAPSTIVAPEVEPGTVEAVSANPPVIYSTNTVNSGTPGNINAGGHMQQMTQIVSASNTVMPAFGVETPQLPSNDVSAKRAHHAGVQDENDNTTMNYDPANDNSDAVQGVKNDKSAVKTGGKKVRQIRDRLLRLGRLLRTLRGSQTSSRTDSRPDNG
jgi:filamentous hemagglutinin family protein